MAHFKFRGLEEYELKLSKLATRSAPVAKKAIGAAAGIVVEAVKKEIRALPILRNEHGARGNLIDGVTLPQRNGLLDGFGISPMMDDNGYHHVKIGVDGYNTVVTGNFPRGQPNVLIARAVDSGNSFRKKNPFVERGVKASRPQALAAMQKIIDDEIEKTMK